MSFLGISMSDTWNFMLAMEDKGFVFVNSARSYPLEFHELSGKFYGYPAEVVLVKPVQANYISAVMVTILSNTADMKSFIKYLDSQYSNRISKGNNVYVWKDNSGDVMIHKEREQISMMFQNLYHKETE